MIDSLSSLAQKAMDEALSLSRYRVAVHECSDFLGCSALQRGGIPQPALAV